jgi:hypothetical protein
MSVVLHLEKEARFIRSRQNGAAETGHWHAGLVCQKRAIGGGSGRRLVSPPHSAKREPGRRKSIQKKGS